MFVHPTGWLIHPSVLFGATLVLNAECSMTFGRAFMNSLQSLGHNSPSSNLYHL
ncbi:hypothetical protein CEV33_3648 [Brucella grignonensis]|uniref:Uncharacterized protein n=1 Tax=Brucella grignonensis TaxID=94627 RepID=A0A256EYN0_9HYPH|nr:hypothetical protein CEV33_3648 [Brucella grignonensis]